MDVEPGEGQGRGNCVIDVKGDGGGVHVSLVIPSDVNRDRGRGAVTCGGDGWDLIVRQHASAKHYRILGIPENVWRDKQAEQDNDAQSSHRFPLIDFLTLFGLCTGVGAGSSLAETGTGA